MVGKEEQGSGVRDAQTWVSRTKRTLRRRGYFPSLESSPPAGGISPKSKTEISPCGASFFLSDQKETKESPGDVAFGKDQRLAPRSFMSHFPPDPCFYGGAGGARGQLRPARKPLEGCLCLLTAVLLNELDRLLLQGTVRLSGATYTVGGRRAATPDALISPRAGLPPEAVRCGPRRRGPGCPSAGAHC